MARKKIITDRKDRIIQSADRLFNHYGWEKTTMEDISREAGIPRATVYLEFSGGKEAILMASIERYMDNQLNTMREIARQSRTGRLETLKQIILHHILTIHDRARDFQYSEPVLEQYTKRVRTEMESFYRARREFFAELLQQAALGGEIPEHYDYLRAAELVEYAVPVFMPAGNKRPRDVVEQDANAFFSLLLTGLAKTPSTASISG